MTLIVWIYLHPLSKKKEKEKEKRRKEDINRILSVS